MCSSAMFAFFVIWHCLHSAVNYHCCLGDLFFLFSEFVCSCLHVVICILLFDFHFAALQKPTGTSQPLATAFWETCSCAKLRKETMGTSDQLQQSLSKGTRVCIDSFIQNCKSLLLLAQIMCKDALTTDLCHYLRNQGKSCLSAVSAFFK